jgi:hypothetical protein
MKIKSAPIKIKSVTPTFNNTSSKVKSTSTTSSSFQPAQSFRPAQTGVPGTGTNFGWNRTWRRAGGAHPVRRVLGCLAFLAILAVIAAIILLTIIF